MPNTPTKAPPTREAFDDALLELRRQADADDPDNSTAWEAVQDIQKYATQIEGERDGWKQNATELGLALTHEQQNNKTKLLEQDEETIPPK